MNFVKIKAPIQMISFCLISVDRKQYELEMLPHICIYIWESIISPACSPSSLVSKKSAVTVGAGEELNQRTELRGRVWRMVVSFTIVCVVFRPLDMNHSHSLDWIGKYCLLQLLLKVHVCTKCQKCTLIKSTVPITLHIPSYCHAISKCFLADDERAFVMP